MRIDKVALHNFRNYDDAVITFREGRTLLVGPNGSGKSTILDAIAWTLTGRCRGVNGKGEGQHGLIRVGAETMKVSVTVSGLGTITRSIDAAGKVSSTMKPEIVLAKLDVTEAMLAATLNGGAFFDLHHADAKRLLLRLLGVTFSSADVGETGDDALTLDDLDQRYQSAYSERADLKRLAVAAGVPEFQARVDLEGQELSVLMGARSKASGVASAAAVTAGAASAALVHAQDALAKLEALDSAEVLRGRRDVHVANKTRATLALDESTKQIALFEGQSDEPAGDLQRRAAELQSLIDKLKRHSPDRGCVLSASIPCHTQPKEFAGHIAGIADEVKSLSERIAAATARALALSAAKNQRAHVTNDIEYAAKQIADLDGQIERAGNAAKHAAELRKTVGSLKRDAKDAKDALDAAGVEANATVVAVDRLASYLAGKTAYVKARDARAVLDAKIKAVEERVERLGPNGIRATKLAAGLAVFEAQMSKALEGFDFTIAISVDPWQVKIAKAGGDAFGYELLSAGEKLWTGFALQIALAKLSGLDFCALDAAETVVGDARAVLTDLILDAPIGQIVVAMAKGANEAVPVLDGLDVLRVQSLREPQFA